MNHRERVLSAISHNLVDRVPMDLGSTHVTGIYRIAYTNLRNYLGLESTEGRIVNKMQQIVLPDEDVLKYFDIDVRGIYMNSPYRSFAKDFEDGSYRDMFGVIRKMPTPKYYYDIISSPFDKEDLTLKEIDKFPWPDPKDPGFYMGIKDKVEKLSKKDYAVVFNLGAAVLQISQFMRGFKLWYEDLILREEIILSILDRLTDFYIDLARESFKRIGTYLDVVYFADDLGTQDNLQFSPNIYRKLIKPFHKRLYKFAKSQGYMVFLHSCGAVFPLIEDLIEIGVDILNPVQVLANGMEISRLKNEFGDRLTFWGAIDCQKLLPLGTVENVGREVKKTVEVLGKSNGYILSASHNIQPDIPPENIVEMYKTAKSLRFN